MVIYEYHNKKYDMAKREDRLALQNDCYHDWEGHGYWQNTSSIKGYNIISCSNCGKKLYEYPLPGTHWYDDKKYKGKE
jgi:hypothetical protein